MSNIEKFKTCMRNLVTGVTIVTTITEGKKKEGVTINTFTSLSLDPLLILFNLKKSSFCYKEFAECDHFNVNILSQGQERLSNAFTKSGESKWALTNITENTTTGVPLIEGCISVLECRKHKIYDGGDHSIIIGEVVNTYINSNKDPLVYFNSNYKFIEK